MKQRGFTIVEITIVIVLIIALTMLGVASLRNSQVTARDDERQVKADTIARALEVFYRSGDTTRGINPGRYPTQLELQAALSGGYIYDWLDGTDASTYTFSWQDEGETNLSFLGALVEPERNQTESSTRIAAAVAGGDIVYEPLAIYDGSRLPGDNDRWVSCYQLNTNILSCERYNLYFERESDGAVVTIRSENQ